MQKNNGITLVVLIIIVVVMLILLSVTVNIAIDGNLFGKAEEAVNKTNKKVGTLQNDVDYYTNLLNKISGTGDSTEFKDIRSNILLDWISLLQTAEGTLNETHSMLSRLNELMFRLNNGTETDISKNYRVIVNTYQTKPMLFHFSSLSLSLPFPLSSCSCPCDSSTNALSTIVTECFSERNV